MSTLPRNADGAPARAALAAAEQAAVDAWLAVNTPTTGPRWRHRLDRPVEPAAPPPTYTARRGDCVPELIRHSVRAGTMRLALQAGTRLTDEGRVVQAIGGRKRRSS